MNIIKFFKQLKCGHNYKIQELCCIRTLHGEIILKKVECSKCGKSKIVEV